MESRDKRFTFKDVTTIMVNKKYGTQCILIYFELCLGAELIDIDTLKLVHVGFDVYMFR